MTTLVIDSRDRINGTQNQFTLYLNPALENVHKVKLIFADIPSDSKTVDSAWYIQIPEFGCPVRSASVETSATFMVPMTAGAGNRTIYSENSMYTEIGNGNGVTLSSINVRLLWRKNQPWPLAGEWVIAVQIE